jgi:hypothetical protein
LGKCQAAVRETRRAGRNYYYSLRREALADLMDVLQDLASTPRTGRPRGTAS